MPTNDTSILLTDIMEYVLDQKASSHRSQSMELRLIKFALPRLDYSGKVGISQAEVTELTGVTSGTIRRFTKDMVESGRWSIVPGDGVSKTVYKPLFLEDLIEAKKKGN